MKHISLFSGIGGFDLASEWMGWENVAHCEWNPFGQRILKYYWPNAISYNDITKTDFTIHRGKIDVLSGGFPCQPYSVAGKRKGKEDERHLWPEMRRAYKEIAVPWLVGENVRGLVNWNGGLVFDEVQADLEADGYEVFPFLLPACGVDAPHRRDRIWFIAYSHDNRESRRAGENESSRKEERVQERNTVQQFVESTNLRQFPANACDQGLQGRSVNRSAGSGRQERNKQLTGCFPSDWEIFPTQSPLCNGNDGFSPRLDFAAVFEGIDKPRKPITFSKWRNESIKAGGNAIVPQVAHQIFKAIQQYELQK